jgi:hypothetical protein
MGSTQVAAATIALALLGALAPMPAAAEVAIMLVTPDYEANRITIRGIGLTSPGGVHVTRVYLETTPLRVISRSETKLVMELPGGVKPGSYLLSVAYGPGGTQGDGVPFTIEPAAVAKRKK